MRTDEIPDRPEVAQASRRAVRRTHLQIVAAALVITLAGFCAATARLFIWPARGMPARVDAIVVLGGKGTG
jgi:hypothetical protein